MTNKFQYFNNSKIKHFKLVDTFLNFEFYHFEFIYFLGIAI